MILSEIKRLAIEHNLETLNLAALAFESTRQNSLKSQGKDDAEILTNLLMAATVREKIEKQGLSLQDAIREHSRSVQKILSGSRKKL